MIDIIFHIGFGVLLFSLGWMVKSLMPNAEIRKNEDDDERTNEEYIWVYLQGKGIDSGWRAYSHHQDSVGIIRATSAKKGLK